MFGLIATAALVTATTGCTNRVEQKAASTESHTDVQTQLNESVMASAKPYHSGFEGGLNSILEAMGGGVGVFDLEGDGQPDLYLPGGGDISESGIHASGDQILRLRTAVFQDQTDALLQTSDFIYSHGVSVTDFDNDGFDDLVVSGYGRLIAWKNNGDGTLANIASDAGLDNSAWSTSLASADLNLDGFADLYVCHYVDWSLEKNPQCFGKNGQPDVCPPRSFEGLDDSIYLNLGDGRFKAVGSEFGMVSGGKGLGVLAADFDSDGDTDVYVANDTTENFLYRNEGGRRLDEIGFSSGTALDNDANANGSMGVTATDFDLDGMTDIFVANYENEVFALYRNLGQLSFLHSSDRFGVSSLGGVYVGFGCVASDLDLDGDEDIVVTNGHVVHFPQNASVRELPLLLRNDGTTFSKVESDADVYFRTEHMGRGLAKLDWNYDGKEDLLFRNSDEASCLVENKSVSSGRCLKLKLIGVAANRKCVGAVIVLHLHDGRQLVRNVFGGGSYLSQSEAVVHLGIPEGATISHLTVQWPGNTSQSLRPCDFAEGLNDSRLIMIIQPSDLEKAGRTYHCPR